MRPHIEKRYAQNAQGQLRIESAYWNELGELVGIGNALAPIARNRADYYAQTVEGYLLLSEAQYQEHTNPQQRNDATPAPVTIDPSDGIDNTEATAAAKALNARRKPKAKKPK